MRVDFEVRGKERKRLAFEVGYYMHKVPVYQMLPTKSYMVDEIEITLDGVLVIPESMDASGLFRHLASCGFSGLEKEEEGLLAIEMPKDGFTQEAIERLRQLVKNRECLFKRAFGDRNLDIQIRTEQIRFPWFEYTEDGQEITAYATFLSKLCELAKKQKRVLDKPIESDNDRYVFRCFLLRLGLIGDQYSKTREILMRHLSGNGAFRHPELEKMIKRAEGAR